MSAVIAYAAMLRVLAGLLIGALVLLTVRDGRLALQSRSSPRRPDAPDT